MYRITNIPTLMTIQDAATERIEYKQQQEQQHPEDIIRDITQLFCGCSCRVSAFAVFAFR
jgi:hypothetical protein